MNRRLGFLAACVAAAAGSATAAAIPAMASSSTAVTVLTVSNISTIGAVTIVQSPSNVDGDLAFLSSGGVAEVGADEQVTAQTVTGPVPYGALAVSDGSSDLVAGGGVLDQVSESASGVSATQIGTATTSGGTIAVGPNGNAFISGGGADLYDCVVGAASTAQCPMRTASGVSAFEGLATAGGELWFSDSAGALGSFTPTGASTGTFSAPVDSGDFSAGPAELTSLGGNLWLVGNNTHPNVIYEVSPASPTTTTSYTVTTPVFPGETTTTPTIASITAAPDGNVWFTDTKNAGVGFIAPTATGDSEYPVPNGNQIDGNIAVGPAGTDTLLFALSTRSGGSLAVNLLGQITSPVALPAGSTSAPSTSTSVPSTSPTAPISAPSTTPATPISAPATTPATAVTAVTTPTLAKAKLRLTATAAVTTRRVAAVKLSCLGAATASCAGELSLTGTFTFDVKVREKVKGKLATVLKLERRTVTLARGSYSLRAGKTETLSLKLSAAGYRRLESAHGHKLKVTATAKATTGTALVAGVTLAGPKPRTAKT